MIYVGTYFCQLNSPAYAGIKIVWRQWRPSTAAIRGQRFKAK
ncbi:hypothetical protein C427_1933 [Paraglaciecola psychrophila 170]|uniref:Uncharacterized protein n=1 Tax=Paraglaciecola psychrophila 170 TaxID=1129794 RepID=M4S018_9ALTE|nr:hypothetical protein C427_1933 [Paraglaciecola psychrophila 170]